MKLGLANAILKIADKYNQVFTQKINEFKMLNNQEPFITTNYQMLVNHEHSQQNKTEIVNFSNPKSEELNPKQILRIKFRILKIDGGGESLDQALGLVC